MSKNNTESESSAMTLMLQMQQQQLAMQEQMTQMMAKLLPTTQSVESTPRQRIKPERPTIEADSTDNKWIIFKDAWTRYKQMAKLENVNDIRNELRSACSASVNEMLFNFVGPDALNTATEDQLLEYVKSVAIRTVHPEVYRQQFFAMKQSDGETVTCFISRLKSQAMLCDFKRKCDCPGTHCTTSYSEDMIKSQAIAGLNNASHQTRILTEVSALKTLSQLIERLLTLESTARAASHFQPFDVQPATQIAPIKSDYQKSKSTFSRRPTPPSEKDKQQRLSKCIGCGRNRHANGRKQCPAQGQKCNNCGRINHFAAVCLGSSSNAVQEDTALTTQYEDVSFLSSISSPPSL